MNTLHLTIGGRSFALAVEPGDEEHVRHLGTQIDAKFQQLAPRYSQNLLFAALQLADDLHQSQTGSSSPSPAADASRSETATPTSAAQLAEATEPLRARIAELEQELAAVAAAEQQSVLDAAVTAADPELARSLEHFAELLEKCADKLERRASAS